MLIKLSTVHSEWNQSAAGVAAPKEVLHSESGWPMEEDDGLAQQALSEIREFAICRFPLCVGCKRYLRGCDIARLE